MDRGHARPKSVGRKAPLPTDYADLRDPANGAKVPRCVRCGMPARRQYKLYLGLWSHIRLNLEVTLCGKCIEELLPDRRALDPLTLDDVA